MQGIFLYSIHVYKYWHHKTTRFNTIDSTRFHNFRSVDQGRLVAVCQGKRIEVNEGELLYLPPEHTADIECFAEPYCNGTVIRLRYFPGEDELSFPAQSVKLRTESLKAIFDLQNNKSHTDSKVLWQVYKTIDLVQKDMIRHTDKNIIKLQKALEFMRENDNYTISEVANYCDMSTRRFNAVFKEALNVTPVQMKEKFQAIKAELLLKSTDLSIEEIANRVGYFSTNQLRNVIKKRYAALPKDIRKYLQ